MHGIVGDGTLLLSVGVILWLGSWAAAVRTARSQGLSTLLWGVLGFVFGPFAVLFLALVGFAENASGRDDTPPASDIAAKPDD